MPIISNFLDFYSKIKNKKYINSAISKLKNCKCKVIAITGSNGKTSTKNILCKMLSKTYKTQATPASYNTPLGISKFINQQLKNDTEFLILEFGARRKNDIKKLCQLFAPDFGIICNISGQHLETFKSIDSVYIAKKELSDYLKTNLCVYNLDNNFCRAMYEIKEGKKIGISIEKKSNYCAKNIEIKNFFTEFDMKLGKHIVHARTKLLGHHNVCNIMLASVLAIHLGVNINVLPEIIENLPFIPHRLEYIKGRINILDDSYNCSLASAIASINVLKTTKNKTMIVTPGIIEAGKTRYYTNFELGKLLANSNYCVIVGTENKQALTDGIKSTNYNLQNLFFATSLEDSKKYYNLLGENDTLLLLNDLPDDYK